ncbi:Protein gir2 [Friedmanniomyces endolithicus]|nr:Protein gir2 [Friedmanniomyces endolithicus]KAK0777754.1 Protein gir2 [Friedmanniomyces endolithicus]KAK0784438.1 Protein gir2 [Friedmanniomyces endolithicus]KAK0787934.1 Protein gir2 [Friedmanniomyces endolithicus]KAK0839099.1 Protein gir2 [Friedmanniomyces endolithicus]
MGREEQKEEREVLDSIFPDEIQDVSASEYRVSIALDVNKSDEDETPDPVILLNIRYPEAYPDEAPRLDITQPPNAPRYDHLDIQNDKARLLEALGPTIEESMGMAMVFALVSALKDAAELLAIQAVKDVESAKAEEEENRKFEGEKVTRESFLAWREGFQREMADEAARRVAEVEAEEKKKRGAREERKLTGKQLWQRGLAGNTVEEDEDEGDDALEGVQKLRVDG